MPFGRNRGERADAARNRTRLLETAREMIDELGIENVTMDGLAERAGLGKGTVFRRFGTRAGIFVALLDETERAFQERVLSGPPPLGPGADPVERLIAYGHARAAFLIEHRGLARAAIDHNQPVPAGQASLSRLHIRMLLSHMPLDAPDLDSLAVQLTAALDGPLLLYLSTDEPGPTAQALAASWQLIVERVCRAA